MSGHLESHLQNIVKTATVGKEIKEKFLNRINQGKPSRDENPEAHFGVFFAPYDAIIKEVFIGHHKKSGLWIFNGGHMDKNEMPEGTLEREILEELGAGLVINKISAPFFLSVTNISIPGIKCKLHYDIWYFLSVQRETFAPDKNLLSNEFHQAGWKTISEAKALTSDSNTINALGEIEKLFS